MSNVERRLSAVVCLTLAMCVAPGNELAAQEPAPAPALRAAIAAPDGVRPRLSPAAPARRPSILVPLYVSFGVMQALDVHSTQRALAGGGVEGNPMMKGIVGSPLAMTALKAGTSAGIILLTEKVRKRHPVAAIAMMVTLNSAYAMVVSRNYSISR
jgi:hypothetical protein